MDFKDTEIKKVNNAERAKMSLRSGVGSKCDICTGCGRCVGVANRADIITQMPLWNVIEQTYAQGETQTETSGTGACLIAADIGTTTIAMNLYGTKGEWLDQYVCVNPQVSYGADVLSRIQASKENADAARDMTDKVRQVLSRGIACFRKKLQETDTVSGSAKDRNAENCAPEIRMVIAANTTMVYLLMGWDATELGQAPFRVSHTGSVIWELEGIPVYIFPALSAFVGGDITAGIVACDMTKKEDITLLVDLGTNGEMVLGNSKRLIACSTAAGPAFEGGPNRGVWGADMVSLLADLRKRKIVDETGLLMEPYFDKGIDIGGVHVTQQSIRAIQLAKGAIVAGIRILADRYGVALEQIDRVVLAGGFGYYLKPEDAASIGLLPRELVEKTVTGGNTALAGALRVGRKLEEDPFWERETLQMELVNLAEVPEFEELYFSSMELC